MEIGSEDDLMARLVAEWRQECPDLDASAMKIVGRIMRLGRQFEREAAEALKPMGLPYTEFDIVATLRRSGPPYELTPGQLSEAVLLTSGAMTAALDRLERAGFVTRHASDKDRRVKTAKLTEEGQAIAETAAQARFAAANRAIKMLPDAQRSELELILAALGRGTV